MALEDGALGSLDSGPSLPDNVLALDAFVIGCGAVTNGWAYTIKRLPIAGTVEAVDSQSLRIENIGPYVLAKRSLLATPKATVIESYLAPRIRVTPRPEELELFKIRIRYGLHVPALIINGLDNVLTRHSVQRLWPKTLIDMAAGGLTSQIIVKGANSESICLLRALEVPPNELDWAERLAKQTGLSAERIRHDPTGEITDADIEAADPALRPRLAAGTLICGRVTEQNLKMEGHDPNFAPAVPFVTAFSGVVGAAETMKYLMGYSHPVHYQRNSVSYKGRALQMKCDPQCECQRSRSVKATPQSLDCVNMPRAVWACSFCLNARDVAHLRSVSGISYTSSPLFRLEFGDHKPSGEQQNLIAPKPALTNLAQRGSAAHSHQD